MDRWSLSLSGNTECLQSPGPDAGFQLENSAGPSAATHRHLVAFELSLRIPWEIRENNILVRRYEAQNAEKLFQNVQTTLILKCIIRIYGWLPRNTTLPRRVSHEDALVPTCSHTFVDSFWIILNPSPVAVGRKCISSPATRGFDVPPESGCWAAQGEELGAQGQPCLRTLGHGSRMGYLWTQRQVSFGD